MKTFLLVSSLFFLSSCGSANTKPTDTPGWGSIRVWRDAEKNREYIIYNTVYGVAIYPRLNTCNGEPLNVE